MLRKAALQFLDSRNAKVGETVQFGWFIFRIIEGEEGLDLETLDFKTVASFTTDFQIPEKICWAQHETLRLLNVEALECRLVDPALVSRSYRPGTRNAYIERCDPVSYGDSGWYVGIVNETLDPNKATSFVHQSLYELTIQDQRLARFWLLPVGYRIYFDADEPRIEKPS